MSELPLSLRHHRVQSDDIDSVVRGRLRYAPAKSLWFLGMSIAGFVGGVATFSWPAFLAFLAITAAEVFDVA